MIVEQANHQAKNNHYSLLEASEIAQPIEHIICLSVNAILIQVSLIGYCDMGKVIRILIGSHSVRFNSKDFAFKLSDWSKLHSESVLQL